MEEVIVEIKLMKYLLLSLLSALALPIAVIANPYDDKLMRTRWPEFLDNYNNEFKFQEVEDFEMTCSSFIKANNELKITLYFVRDANQA